MGVVFGPVVPLADDPRHKSDSGFAVELWYADRKVLCVLFGAFGNLGGLSRLSHGRHEG
jgi:hypothetical protein